MLKTNIPGLFSVLLCAALFLVQCKKEEIPVHTTQTTEQTTVAPEVQDSAVAEVKNQSAPTVPQYDSTYEALILPADKKQKDSAMAEFKKKYTADQIYTILALNRLDKKNLWHADTLMIPKKIEENFLAYSPFPAKMNILNDVKKMVIFSYPIQAYAVYENGNLQKWGPSSMGKKKAQTKRGLMFANWKKELAISTVKSEWKLPYNFNIHNTLGIGWHQYDLPGYPASHSCLRLLEEDAKWLYNFADTWILNKGGATTKAKGTPVLVYGEYGWGKAKPWKSLDKNPNATDISEEQLNVEIQPFMDKILEEQKNRDEVLAAKTDTIAAK